MLLAMKIWKKEREKTVGKLNSDNGLYIRDTEINMTEFLYTNDWENGNALTEIGRSGYKVWWCSGVDDYCFTYSVHEGQGLC